MLQYIFHTIYYVNNILLIHIMNIYMTMLSNCIIWFYSDSNFLACDLNIYMAVCETQHNIIVLIIIRPWQWLP